MFSHWQWLFYTIHLLFITWRLFCSDPYNSSDEKKLRYSSTSLTPEKHPLPTAHHWPATEEGELVSSPVGSSGSNSRKRLTRKKWLETSEGGLLFGSPQLYQGQGTDSEHEVHRPSHTASVRRLVPRSPQTQADTVARQPVVMTWRFLNAVITTLLLLLFQDLKERVELRMRAIADAEKRIDELQKEKHQVRALGSTFFFLKLM